MVLRLARVVILFVALVCSGQAEINSPDNNKIQHTAKVQGASTANQAVPEPQTIIVKISPPDEAQDRTESEKEDRWEKYWDSVTARATFFVCIFTGLLAWFTLRLWAATKLLVEEAKEASKAQSDDMKESLRISEKSADATRALVETTKESLRISRESADSTKLMVETMKENAEMELRAYISVDMPGGTKNLQDTALPRKASLTIKNGGRTPAYDVRFNAQWAYTEGTRAEWPTGLTVLGKNTVMDKDGSTATLGSGQIIHPEFSLDDTQNGKTFEEIFGRFQRKEKITIFLQGVFKYRDAFKEPRFTQFCHYYEWTSENEFIAFSYRDHNDAD